MQITIFSIVSIVYNTQIVLLQINIDTYMTQAHMIYYNVIYLDISGLSVQFLPVRQKVEQILCVSFYFNY